jgi:hypothetical protein
MKGVEPLSTGLQDRRSGIHLSYIAEQNVLRSLHSVLCLAESTTVRLSAAKEEQSTKLKGQSKLTLVDREGFKPTQEVCKTPMLSFTSPAHWQKG